MPLLGTFEVDYYFPTVTIIKMVKMHPIAGPRYSMDDKKSKELENSLRKELA